MKTCTISHESFVAPDWAALRADAPEIAAGRLQGILTALDANEKRIYVIRGFAGRLIEERELFREITDEEVGERYQSFDKFLKDICPNSSSYVREAMRAVEALPDMLFEDLLLMKRCNILQLTRVSSGVRVLPEVIEAAKRLPEKALVEKLNSSFHQHLEPNRPVVMAPAGDVDEFEQAVEMVTLLDDCHSRAEALKAIGVRIIQECAAEWEHRKQEATA